MSRKGKNTPKPPYFHLTAFTEGKLLLAVTSTETPSVAPFQKMYGANMKVTVGTDRLALACTLVELARDLVKEDEFLHAILDADSTAMASMALRSGGRFVVKAPEDLPF